VGGTGGKKITLSGIPMGSGLLLRPVRGKFQDKKLESGGNVTKSCRGSKSMTGRPLRTVKTKWPGVNLVRWKKKKSGFRTKLSQSQKKIDYPWKKGTFFRGPSSGGDLSEDRKTEKSPPAGSTRDLQEMDGTPVSAGRDGNGTGGSNLPVPNGNGIYVQKKAGKNA